MSWRSTDSPLGARRAPDGAAKADQAGAVGWWARAQPPGQDAGRRRDRTCNWRRRRQVIDGRPGRIRLAHIKDYSADTLHGFLNRALEPGTTAQTDAWSA